MRKKFVAGNWKMFTNLVSAQQLAGAVVAGCGSDDRVSVALCPPFPYLPVVASCLKGSKVALGGQNLYPEKEGAFTGEVSPAMLLDVGCRYVILGHSERRHKMGENDEFINRKVHAALTAGLAVILCVGETIEERQGNRTESVIERQLVGGLGNVALGSMAKVVIAYEPVWAIGTGLNASPAQAQDVHQFIRKQIGGKYGEEVANSIPIQYGGSVKPDNAALIMSQPDVDGALVGGASLQVESFLAIVKAANAS